ncbi:hypothetical protein ATE84_0750 [Aquimarina sp. MAR_2010_214]|uniref:hypothetical protein n=1 Tax=Aquimarina sp. MAR_2010_214 TaxID=1250026 RepID=UPI000C70A41E|nr:hypothetical protein [Aquimarina sp. MAR_2010_214]PKV48742.1 hypothetical protein ATE84_0750 [Aquimarina sp. MAR_2010_214]
MKNTFILSVVLLSFYSCITIHKVRQVDNFRIETENMFNEESFLFKPNMYPEEAKRSLRKQFGLTNDQNLSDFDVKLFDNFDVEFNVKISFDVDREESMNFASYLINKEDYENDIGDAETFVKIIIVDTNGDNCLSTRSLFYNKTRSYLIDIKNNIKIEPLY